MQPGTSSMIQGLAACFTGLEDPRETSRCDHQLTDIVVSAWASEQGLALGQRAVDAKSNEIAAIPELLETLDLEGCIVTLDAMGCQKNIAAQIRAKGADYLLVLKANHGRAFEAVREQFERTCLGRGCKRRPVFDAFDEGHGRLVRRRVFVALAVQD